MLAKTSGNQLLRFPYTLADLRSDFPSVSIPNSSDFSALADYGVVEVVATSAPKCSSLTHRLTSAAELIDGEWRQTWKAVPLPESTASSNVRIARNQRLADSDWTQLADAPVDASPWATYRQALRDITLQSGFPHNVTWPELPSGSDSEEPTN